MNELDKKSKKLLLTFIIIYSVIVIAILIYIWIPKKSQSGSDINKYSSVEYKNKMSNYYFNDFINLVSNNDNNFYSKINSSYLDKNNLTEFNYKEFLKEHIIGDKIKYSNYSMSSQGSIDVYRIEYTADGVKNYLIVSETKPYEYTFSFEKNNVIPNFTNNSGNKTSNTEGIDFKIVELERKIDSIKYSVTVTNENEFDVEFNFDDINNVVLVLSDGTLYRMASSVITMDEDGILSKGSSMTKEIFFSISSEQQSKISKINFKNIKFGENKKNISINM